MAQLTVKPNGAQDSYVFVNDEILYVTDYVNLTKNAPGTQVASIYLRNNAQLIQSGTSSTNSGTGQLSVQQNTPDTNAWAYYYWCSPIGNSFDASNNATAPGNRNFGIKHLFEALPGTSVTAAQQVMPIGTKEGYTDPQLTISTRWLYTFPGTGIEAEYNYVRMNGNNAAEAGKGFIMKGVNEGVLGEPLVTDYNQLYEFRGRPNNGDFSITVAKPTIILPNPLPQKQMTLSGNPYPSALDLNQLFYEPGNEELGELFYYDEDRTVDSHFYANKPFGYGVWVPDGPDSSNMADNDPSGTYTAAPFYIYRANGNTNGGAGTSTNNDQNKRYAPIGQGIMFVGNDFVLPSDGVVTIKNSHRIFVKEDVPLGGSVFQRPDSNRNDDSEIENNAGVGSTLSSSAETSRDNRTSGMRLWAIFDDAVTRDMVLNFSDQATDGYDRGFDGGSPQGLKTDAYFLIGNDNNRMPYVINATNYDVNKQIPIAFKLEKQTNIELRVKEEVKKPYQHAYLFDSQENTYKVLTSTTAARVSLTLPAGKYENRFFIVFRSPLIKSDTPKTELERTELVRANVNFFQNNPQHQLEIRNPEGYTIKTASVYDMSGKLVISEKNLGDDNKYSFYTGNLSDGVYLVKLMTSDDVSIDYKAIVHNQ